MTADANKLTARASTAAPDASGVTADNPGAIVRIFVDALKRLGYDTETILRMAGLNPADLADPDARIPCAMTGAVLGAAMQQRVLKNLAARLAAETPMGAYPLIDYLVLTSPTVGDGLKQLARYLRLTGAPYSIRPIEDQDPVRVVFDSSDAFAVEYAVTLCTLHLRDETDQRLVVTSVSFSQSPDDPAELRQILGCPVHTKTNWSGLELRRESWEMPLRRRDAVLHSVLERHAAEIISRIPETDSFAFQVRRVLAAQMAKGTTEIQNIARALATSTRSLQRRLAAAGVSYQQLLDLTRRDAAGEFLGNPTLSIGEVAYLLGYSEPAAFHRAFKRWNGMTPQAFREARRSPSGQHP